MTPEERAERLRQIRSTWNGRGHMTELESDRKFLLSEIDQLRAERDELKRALGVAEITEEGYKGTFEAYRERFVALIKERDALAAKVEWLGDWQATYDDLYVNYYLPAVSEGRQHKQRADKMAAVVEAAEVFLESPGVILEGILARRSADALYKALVALDEEAPASSRVSRLEAVVEAARSIPLFLRSPDMNQALAALDEGENDGG